jgi:undecaprenyl-diphosphatase
MGKSIPSPGKHFFGISALTETMMEKLSGAAIRFQQLAELELAWCLRINRIGEKRLVEQVFAVVSRLGDGIFWYTLMVTLLVFYGSLAIPAVGRMLTVGFISLLLYKWLKAKTTRPRPCNCNTTIRITVPPLDLYSFPSGHTLHAVAFSIVAVFHFPRLVWLVLPFTLLVALSRLVLGLHYPSDVLAGALLGTGLSIVVLHY